MPVFVIVTAEKKAFLVKICHKWKVCQICYWKIFPTVITYIHEMNSIFHGFVSPPILFWVFPLYLSNQKGQCSRCRRRLSLLRVPDLEASVFGLAVCISHYPSGSLMDNGEITYIVKICHKCFCARYAMGNTCGKW